MVMRSCMVVYLPYFFGFAEFIYGVLSEVDEANFP